MSIFSFWGTGNTPSDELPAIFPLAFRKDQFIEIDVINIYQKILTDVIERTHGLSDEQAALLWDNCVQSEASHGLITLLAKAMTYRKELFLIYDKGLKLLRTATTEEQEQIRADYKKSGKSSVGAFISFAHFIRSDMVCLYSALEYCTVASLHKQMNVSVATQLKISDLRASTSLMDSADVKAQAMKIARSLSKGNDIMLDAKDEIVNAVPDLTAVQTAIEYLNEKRAFYLGMPACYITGEQTGGLGSSGEQDTKAIERGLKNYYFSIVKPVLEVLFGIKPSYKSQDFRQIDQAMNALKTFAITDDSILNLENKTLIINKLLDLDEDEHGDPVPEPDPGLPPIPPKQIPPGQKPGNA